MMRPHAVAGLLAAIALAAGPAQAQSDDLKRPDPAYEPREVVEIQLEALQANNSPNTDAGIAQAWAFAHPENRAQTGPVAALQAHAAQPALCLPAQPRPP